MKKILLGLFILGTLGMAQNNYEVYVKNGVKISQSEVDRNSREIGNVINGMIDKFNREDKKIILEKSRVGYKKIIDSYISVMAETLTSQKEKEMFTSFMNKISEIVDKNIIGQLDNMEMYVSKINFVSRNEANVEIIIKSKDLGEISEFDSLYLEAFEKAGISNNVQLEDIKEKLDKFYKYFEEQVKDEIENTDYTEELQELKFKKVNGKWITEDTLYDISDLDYILDNMIDEGN